MGGSKVMGIGFGLAGQIVVLGGDQQRARQAGKIAVPQGETDAMRELTPSGR